MRVIVRRERPHPGAQLRFDDVDGYRLTGFATNTTRGQLADLELRHRRRARCEDRIRAAKDSGLANLPLHGFDQNRIWCQIVALAGEITHLDGTSRPPHPPGQTLGTQTAPLPIHDPGDPGTQAPPDPDPHLGPTPLVQPGRGSDHHAPGPTSPSRLTPTHPSDRHHPKDPRPGQPATASPRGPLSHPPATIRPQGRDPRPDNDPRPPGERSRLGDQIRTCGLMVLVLRNVRLPSSLAVLPSSWM